MIMKHGAHVGRVTGRRGGCPYGTRNNYRWNERNEGRAKNTSERRVGKVSKIRAKINIGTLETCNFVPKTLTGFRYRGALLLWPPAVYSAPQTGEGKGHGTALTSTCVRLNGVEGKQQKWISQNEKWRRGRG